MMMTCGLAQQVGVEPQRALAARHDQPHVAVLDAVALERLVDRLGHGRPRDRDLQPDRLGGVPQALQMFVQAKDLAAVAAHALEDAVAEQEPVIEDADAGLVLVDKLAVDVDLQRHGRVGILARRCASHAAWTWPSTNCTVQSACSAMAKSCVTMTIVRFSSRFKVRRMRRISAPFWRSRFPVGSSASSNLGCGDQGACDGRPLHFASRQLARPVLQAVRQSDQVQQSFGPLDVGPLAAPVPPDALARS